VIKPEETVEGTNAQMKTRKRLEGAGLFCCMGVGWERRGGGRELVEKYRPNETQTRQREGCIG
jgi:hypothetical protein